MTSKDTTKSNVELKDFVFTDEHLFDPVGDTPHTCMQCRKCDKLATHHLNYSCKETITNLIQAEALNGRIDEMETLQGGLTVPKGSIGVLSGSKVRSYVENRIAELKALQGGSKDE